MWDAILASVPHQPGLAHPSGHVKLTADQLEAYAGQYSFSSFAGLRITVPRTSSSPRQPPPPVYGIGLAAPIELQPLSALTSLCPAVSGGIAFRAFRAARDQSR